MPEGVQAIREKINKIHVLASPKKANSSNYSQAHKNSL